ncbi:MAG: ATP-binding protein [Haloechinothrix sp.]
MNSTGTKGGLLRTVSLRRRVSFVVLALLAVLLVVLGVFVDLALGARLREDLRDQLRERASLAAELAESVSAEELVRRLAGDGMRVRLETAEGRVLGSGPASPVDARPGPPLGVPPAAQPGRAGDVVERDGVLSIIRDVQHGRLTLSTSETDMARTLTQLRLFVVSGAIGVLLLAGMVVGRLVSGALAPLDTMTALARSITAGDRGRRLSPARVDTEQGRVAAAFDEMLDALEGAERAARDGEHRMREFLSDASHELRTPLASVQAGAETLLREQPGRVERDRFTAGVIREACRAARLVDDLLTMARADAGLDIQHSPVDLRAVAEQQAERVRIVDSEARIEVRGEPVNISGDPDRLGQVLANLLDNALRATDGAGPVSVLVSRRGDEAHVEVQDCGPGIPEGDRDRVFDRFVRLDPARGRAAGGAGLGLPISRAIARAHGGDLVCLPSTIGALFRLTLPSHGH